MSRILQRVAQDIDDGLTSVVDIPSLKSRPLRDTPQSLAGWVDIRAWLRASWLYAAIYPSRNARILSSRRVLAVSGQGESGNIDYFTLEVRYLMNDTAYPRKHSISLLTGVLEP